LTTARYFTPKGRSIQATGIAPDIVIENPPTPVEAKAEEKNRVPLGLREENLPGHLQNQQLLQELKEQKELKEKELKDKEPPKSLDKDKDGEKASPQSGGENTENDVQLRRALEMLKGWDVFKQLVLQKQAG
jgi:carboxyl-terminal processing protease